MGTAFRVGDKVPERSGGSWGQGTLEVGGTREQSTRNKVP